MKRAAKRDGLPDGAQEPEGGRGRYRASMAATATLALVATGGVVSDNTANPVRHLMALGPQTPSRSPTVVTAAATTTVPPTTTTTVPLPWVVSITPHPGASGVALSQRVTIVLSRSPQPGAPMPTLVPPVAGRWTTDEATLTFVPAGGYEPWATERLVIPARLALPQVASSGAGFVVQGPNILRVEQLLAELKYLPLRFGLTAYQTSLVTEPSTAAAVPSAPQPGEFTWRYPDVPASLTSLWSPDQSNLLTTGAVMQFEAQENMPTDDTAGPQVWKSLTAAVAARRVDPDPYDYLMVNENLPESLVVWRDGREIYKTPVNTGVYGATTQTGTFPVYARFLTTTMKGTDPDGFKYDVPNVPWVAYFNGGDAVHGYWRYSYGYPQSNGCVELPIANAQVVWSMDPLGTLVTVSG